MHNIICIVQARMSSTRLPGKVMLDLAGKPVIEQVFNQLLFSKLITKIVLATSNDASDDLLELWAKKNNKPYYRGSLENVLERYYFAAGENHAELIVRITADCPLIDPYIVDKAISKFLEGKYDYISNSNPATFPDGLDCEVFTYSVLEKTYQNAIMKLDKEHVTTYIRKHPALFNIGNLESEVDYSKYRLTLDQKEDYKLIKNIYDNFLIDGNFIPWLDVIQYLDSNPELLKINANINRNEGLLKSLKEDVN